jgi:heme oxygenase
MLSNYLKLNSRKDHDSIESKVDLVKLATNQNHYNSLLKAMFGFYISIETALLVHHEEFKNLGIDLKERLKKDLLTEDLKHFNIDTEDLPRCEEIPSMRNIHEAMGVLYVLEGSTMGGQIIYKQLLKSNIISEGSSGGNFFKPYGLNTMPMWLSFKKSLDLLTDQQDDIVLNKARETFNKMEDWLVKEVV